ncbi:hypothetical protein FisN_13Lh301 [Fistulifera solaris]|uniref:L domain-like protein n=1 Tax=Fistulifera solaris TaxID=1519565 RepID=A0A1Z5KLF5_FISSO|nr:hypothetical protein FisN_13Lh301 [Fistulifera solaris]|eukprot:GAX27150.1 hypothetical protein FisN_13Lh301 [Fistulifera solaris]
MTTGTTRTSTVRTGSSRSVHACALDCISEEATTISIDNTSAQKFSHWKVYWKSPIGLAWMGLILSLGATLIGLQMLLTSTKNVRNDNDDSSRHGMDLEAKRDYWLSTYQHLQSQNVTTTTMLIPGSPQWNALQWLVTSDPLAPLSRDRLLQRYALACLYFHWDGWLFSTAAAGWLDLVTQAAVSPDGMVTVVAPSAELSGAPATTKARVPLHECQWLGVTCNDQKQVVGLDFKSASFVISGMVPMELGLLSHLTVLDCAGKSLVGTFPVTLPQLKYLDLKGNRLNVFQEEWGAWTNLETVNLAENRFEGTIPGSTLAQWSNLRHFDIHSMPVAGNFWQDVVPYWPLIEYVDISLTELSGSIPEVTADGPLSRLMSLYASNTPMTGTLPASLTIATGLISLQLNDITGLTPSPLSAEIGKWTKLETLGLTSPTALAGTLPTEIGLMTSLRELNVYSNRGLNGTLPTELGHLKELQILKVCYTDLSGTVPDEIGTLKKLNDVQLHQTNLVGTVPLGLCSGLLNVLAADCGTLNEGIAPQMECPLGCCDCYA